MEVTLGRRSMQKIKLPPPLNVAVPPGQLRLRSHRYSGVPRAPSLGLAPSRLRARSAFDPNRATSPSPGLQEPYIYGGTQDWHGPDPEMQVVHTESTVREEVSPEKRGGMVSVHAAGPLSFSAFSRFRLLRFLVTGPRSFPPPLAPKF